MAKEASPAAEARPEAKAEVDDRAGAPAEPDVGSEPASAEAPPFRLIVERYETPLLRYLRRVADPEDAEDLAQEAFLRLHGRLGNALAEGREDAVRDVASWLFKVAHNLALDSIRRRRSREGAKERAARELPRGAAGGSAGGSAGGDDESSPEGLAALIRRAACEKALEELAKLPARQRRVLLLKVVQDFKIREIAEITGLTPGNAGYHLNAGLAELARRLKAAGVI